MCYLHDTRLSEVDLLLFGTAVFTVSLLLVLTTVLCPLPLLPRIRVVCPLAVLVGCTRLGEQLQAVITFCDHAALELREDSFSRNLVFALHARSGCKGAMALDQLVRMDSGKDFQVVNVLRVLGQKLALVLEKCNEGVGGREGLGRGEDVLCN
jgi:hypothetical protein